MSNKDSKSSWSRWSSARCFPLMLCSLPVSRRSYSLTRTGGRVTRDFGGSFVWFPWSCREGKGDFVPPRTIELMHYCPYYYHCYYCHHYYHVYVCIYIYMASLLFGFYTVNHNYSIWTEGCLKYIGKYASKYLYIYICVYIFFGLFPFPVLVTTMFFQFLVGDPYTSLHLPLLLERGTTQCIYKHEFLKCISCVAMIARSITCFHSFGCVICQP